MKTMKKTFLMLMAGIILLFQTGCFGSFKLTVSLYNWNKNVGKGIGQQIIFWLFCIIPVYPAAGFLDCVIFNLVEFWSGTNPLAMKEGESVSKTVAGNDGSQFRFTASRNKVEVTQISGPDKGATVEFIYDQNDKTMYVEDMTGKHRMFSFHEENDTALVDVYTSGGKTITMNAGISDVAYVRSMLSAAHYALK